MVQTWLRLECLTAILWQTALLSSTAACVAIQNGITIKITFWAIKILQKPVHLPLILMGYLNPVMQYGIEKFCMDAHNAGIDGIILPDLPLHEYETEHQHMFQKYNLHFIFLITPETSEERIRKIDDASNGFIYAVSSSSITGTDEKFRTSGTLLRKT